MRSRDPLADPAPLIRRVYGYVAYRIGSGPDAEDVTSETIERGLRYRSSFDPRKGDAAAWLIGIARGCVNDHLRSRPHTVTLDERVAADDERTASDRRIDVQAAVAGLDQRDRELVALRYGADLSSKEIAGVLGMSPGAVDVALHRCRERLRETLESPPSATPRPVDARSDLAPQGSG